MINDKFFIIGLLASTMCGSRKVQYLAKYELFNISKLSKIKILPRHWEDSQGCKELVNWYLGYWTFPDNLDIAKLSLVPV